jgi:hypothetical protein
MSVSEERACLAAIKNMNSVLGDVHSFNAIVDAIARDAC